MSEYYELLGVARTATQDDIKRAYRRLAMEFHPDRNPAAEAEGRFKEITEAYEVLRDPQQRAAYDRYGKPGLGRGGGGGFAHVDLSEALNIFMRDFGGFGGFEGIFGGGRGASEARAGQDIRVTITLSLADVATGAKRKLKVKTLLRCDNCSGTGGARGTRPSQCGTCGGSGEVRRAARSLFGQFVSVSPCPTCAGEGTVIQSPCEVCRGEGRVRGERTVSVEIPAGVSSNNYITLRGQGAAGPRNGPHGDLLVLIEVAEDERFTREGDDLTYEQLVSFSLAALGGEVVVPTPWGDERVKIPSGLQSGTILRLKGKGLPRLGQSGNGDLNVRVHVWTPEHVSDHQRALFQELALHEGDPPKRNAGFWSKLKEALGA